MVDIALQINIYLNISKAAFYCKDCKELTKSYFQPSLELFGSVIIERHTCCFL